MARTGQEPSAAARTELESCHLGHCPVGKLPLGKIRLGKCLREKNLKYNYPGINRETISSILELDVGWGRFSMAKNR